MIKLEFSIILINIHNNVRQFSKTDHEIKTDSLCNRIFVEMYWNSVAKYGAECIILTEWKREIPLPFCKYYAI